MSKKWSPHQDLNLALLITKQAHRRLCFTGVESTLGIEPKSRPYQGRALPLCYADMVRETGFEPANPLVPGQVLYQTELLSDGVPCRTRTCGLLHVREMLLPFELTEQRWW